VNLAPNGKPSNLTPEQYRLVRTPAFKEWFGDWENSPKTASKVVDENGEPLVVRHFSQKNKKFFTFEDKSKKNDWSVSKEGFYFTSISAKELNDAYNRTGKGVLYEVFLNIKNILDLGIYDSYDFITNKPIFWNKHHFEMIDKYVKSDEDGVYSDYSEFDKKTDYTAIETISKEHKNKLIKLGYNGIWGKKSNDNYETIDEIVAFYPNQIKLADGTNTTFDASSDDIRYEIGGVTKAFNYTIGGL
jgi:hypothetical protein